MNDLSIFTYSAVYFAAPYLAEALSCNLYVIDDEYNDHYPVSINIQCYSDDNIPDTENIIIIGQKALKEVEIYLKSYKNIILILSDTNSCRKYKYINYIVSEYDNISVFTMPDLIQYFDCPVKPIYQYMRLPSIGPIYDPTHFTISHSPGNKKLFKGTAQIQRDMTMIDANFYFKMISGKTWIDCLKDKAESDLFIDQLIYGNDKIAKQRWGSDKFYNGGLGKSGIEAILLGVPVITGAYNPCPESEYVTAGAFWTDYNNFINDVIKLMYSKTLRDDIIYKQNQWALKYCNPDFIKDYLLQDIKGI